MKLLAGLARDEDGLLPACADGSKCWSDGTGMRGCTLQQRHCFKIKFCEDHSRPLLYTSTHRHSSQQGGQSAAPGPGLGRASPCADRASQSSESAGRVQLVSGTCEVMPWRPSQLTTLTRLVQLRGERRTLAPWRTCSARSLAGPCPDGGGEGVGVTWAPSKGVWV